MRYAEPAASGTGATEIHEPCQVGNEAALRGTFCVMPERLGAVGSAYSKKYRRNEAPETEPHSVCEFVLQKSRL